MEIQIQHDPDRQQFFAVVEGQRSVLDYERVDEGTLDYRSTVVAAELRNRGIGHRLAEHALDYAKANGYKVIPSCPFVAAVVEENEEYAELVAASG